MKLILSALLLICSALPAWSQEQATVSLEYANPQLNPSSWTLTLSPDGRAHFHSEAATASAATSKQPGTVEKPNPAASLDRDVQLSPAFASTIFAAARSHKLFQIDCESHLKVAFTGWKTFSYQGPGGSGSCRFNYSKDKQIQELGDELISAAATIMTGARLESLLQHDRLGLDKEMEYFTDAVDHGRALELGAIREILSRLAADDSVLDRVKRRARSLLARVEN